MRSVCQVRALLRAISRGSQVAVAKVKELAQLIKLSRKTVAYTGAGNLFSHLVDS